MPNISFPNKYWIIKSDDMNKRTKIKNFEKDLKKLLSFSRIYNNDKNNIKYLITPKTAIDVSILLDDTQIFKANKKRKKMKINNIFL